jgi:hypothetical protein
MTKRKRVGGVADDGEIQAPLLRKDRLGLGFSLSGCSTISIRSCDSDSIIS